MAVTSHTVDNYSTPVDARRKQRIYNRLKDIMYNPSKSKRKPNTGGQAKWGGHSYGLLNPNHALMQTLCLFLKTSLSCCVHSPSLCILRTPTIVYNCMHEVEPGINWQLAEKEIWQPQAATESLQ